LARESAIGARSDLSFAGRQALGPRERNGSRAAAARNLRTRSVPALVATKLRRSVTHHARERTLVSQGSGHPAPAPSWGNMIGRAGTHLCLVGRPWVSLARGARHSSKRGSPTKVLATPGAIGARRGRRAALPGARALAQEREQRVIRIGAAAPETRWTRSRGRPEAARDERLRRVGQVGTRPPRHERCARRQTNATSASITHSGAPKPACAARPEAPAAG